MYGNCTVPSTLCLYTTAPADGMCTSFGCSNPAVDCGAAPVDATATPACGATGDAVPEYFCYLDCAVGGSGACPAGMVCSNVTINSGPTVSMCV